MINTHTHARTHAHTHTQWLECALLKDAHLLPEHLQCEPVDSSGVGGGSLLSLPHVAILAVGCQLGGEEGGGGEEGE